MPPASLRSVAAAWLVVAALAPTSRAQVDPGVLAAFEADPIRFYFDQRPADAIQCALVVLRDPDIPPAFRNEVLTTVGTIHLASGHNEEARNAFLGMLAGDPALDLPSAAAMPRAVVAFYYSLRDSVLTASNASVATDLRTLAVGDIENNSPITDGDLDLDRFARGLRHILTTDLLGATPLRLVDRQRLDVLQQEIGMSRSEDIIDPNNRVRVGRLTGAQSYLFGNLMQLEDDRIHLSLRWVDTATGEILLSESVEGKFRSTGDLLKLERKLLEEHLLPKVRVLLGEEAEGTDLGERARELLESRRKALPDRDSYVTLVLQAGTALLAEERGDLAAAQTAWSEVHRLDPEDEYAEVRQAGLRAYQGLS